MGLQTRLYIENFSGKIVIQNLESNSGIIQTFPLEARAADDQKGRDGGVVAIEIFNGSGTLNIHMKGENGGNGGPAQAADQAIKGTPGTRGIPSKFSMGQMFSWVCSSDPGAGGKGGRGLQGYPGKNGRSGGNSGEVKVKSHSEALTVNLFATEGSKGRGSIGGEGGAGGDPGMGGDGAEKDLELYLRSIGCKLIPGTDQCLGLSYPQTKCTPAANGERGDQGLPGINGNDGENGLRQPSCLIFTDKAMKCTN